LLADINSQLFSPSEVCPEFLLWAISGSGLGAPRRNYEVLETYGDTLLKLAATLCAYQIYKDEAKAGEGEIENTKVLFVTNMHTYRIGYHQLRLHRFIRLCKDLEPKQWQPPFQGKSPRANKCTGGSIADSVESLLGALFLTTDSLYAVFEWIDRIKLVPLQALG
jgi:dsRNA-specific ribonuclease